ncbi:related to ADH7-NADP(H)-dependent alcohol dehydrogenase [Fusarium fujikuroi IMI 58289]|uniref:Related to ADH7-NADP(H)-dependent alcohol dehydrogenase n=1 Tax=Gibberella fujikuroi (strain CBS 195.34 / IMI 58289 / NRRL A-6831) TaxID=1279085 RepID=S0EDE5_GIBF5|nr:related to ADH7-NADP(H)-dependent alcohol dehydrogenase [Fusarium fujikuroi IMI 58289]CCT72899.1 related to ADH7-NADP(H)-dependent alcohol dehydrogenase [Fusarium fujikuroi IMI 58289]SCO24990.1 related to ADH7-NADP(H)-dependent alcohol dehydrogenase [Fusarium fujikuroi]
MSSITVYRGTPSGRVQQATVPRPGPPKAHQVTVRITHSGLCGTDEHYKCQDMVLGHEGVGIVDGDRVGWGYCHGSCLNCEYCDQGQELYCEQRQFYSFDEFDQGSFATYATWNEHFVFRIPDSIPSAEAAPLMCAGAAVYSALRSAQVQWYHRVGVLGLGGLGHLAVQYAAKMGCHVTVYSHSSGKEKAARKLGASDFQVMGESSPPSRAVDCLLLTGAQQPDWSQALSLVRRGGVISAVTVVSSELRCPYGEILMNAIRIQGSLPAAPNLQREMLSFSALHGIKPVIETFPFTEKGINEAMEKLRQGKMRYRGVLAMEG